MKKILLLTTMLGNAMMAPAQSGELRGRIMDAVTGEELPYATVAIVTSGSVLTGTSADSLGNYKIKPLDAGAYTVQASFVGYKPGEITGVIVNSGRITFLDFELSNDNTLPPVDIPAWRDPLIKKDEMTTMFSLDAGQIENAAVLEIRDLAAMSPAVVQLKENGPIHVRGSRPNATQFIVNGVRARPDVALPRRCIERLEVLTGGIPAQFGDATGGFVVITTRSYREH